MGPNLAAFIGHSDMRTATMGLDRATRKDERPTRSEQAEMERMLGEALDAGFVGMSSQQLLFDKLDGDICRSRTLPSTYAKPRELRRLKSMLRRSGRILQSGPDIQNPLNLASQLAQSLGLFRRKLKTSLLSAADVKSNPYAIRIMGPSARLIEPARRRLPLAASAGAVRGLRRRHRPGDLRGVRLPAPPHCICVTSWSATTSCGTRRTGAASARTTRASSVVRVWHRDFFDAEIVDCPDASVIGKSFGQVGTDRGGLHPVDAFLDLVLEHGRALRWRTTISNHRPEVLKQMAREPGIQMGFSDAGAHLRNMAFYNSGLRLLRHVRDAERAGKPFMTVEHAVHRMTGELADWYRLDAGHLRIGDRADLMILDPEKLDAGLETYAEDTVEQYGGMARMVNRNDDTVNAVFVGGQAVFVDGEPTEVLGTRRTGSFLRAGSGHPRPLDERCSRRCPLNRRPIRSPRLCTACGRRCRAGTGRSLETYLSDDCIYLDVPVGPAAAARGPEDIVKRLKIGLEPLASYENFAGLMVDNGADVMYEHHEEWHWRTGESALLKFVTVHRVENGKITAVEGLLGHGGAGQLRAPDLVGRFRQSRHVVGVRRHRPGLRSPEEESCTT